MLFSATRTAHICTSGQDSAVHLHLKETNHSFEENNVNILVREDSWIEREVKESIYVKMEQPSLNRGGRLRLYLSLTHNAALSSLPREHNNHSHLGSPRPNKPHEGQLGQQITRSPNDSETWLSLKTL